MCSCRVGVLRSSSGEIADLSLNQVRAEGMLRIVPQWSNGAGLSLLVLLPLGHAVTGVWKSGRPQAGAFILLPGEEFSTRSLSDGETIFSFEPLSSFEVAVSRGNSCSFCRTVLDGKGTVLTQERFRRSILCNACAMAWAHLKGTAANVETTLWNDVPYG
ncbi:MAG: hypothetical protein C4576_35410 [Desulfobacteraceae bacterium]|nr:MAG: hypothetical protein C4576_35410 [Desulfobacteraceae bacterium]